MKLSEWNELLFRKLVAETGSPGDPLYIYVDAEVLAEIGGLEIPTKRWKISKELLKDTISRQLIARQAAGNKVGSMASPRS